MVDPTALEAVIQEAGLGSRSAKKLRDANEPTPESRPRGHGAPAQDLIKIDEI